MSFIKKTLASFGIGSAKVDSVLQQEVLYPGQSVKVIIHVYGGASAQRFIISILNFAAGISRKPLMIVVSNKDSRFVASLTLTLSPVGHFRMHLRLRQVKPEILILSSIFLGTRQ